MANPGLFITCVFLGRRFVKIGRSTNLKKRRNQLRSGCPFRLKIEHVELMSLLIRETERFHIEKLGFG